MPTHQASGISIACMLTDVLVASVMVNVDVASSTRPRCINIIAFVISLPSHFYSSLLSWQMLWVIHRWERMRMIPMKKSGRRRRKSRRNE